MANKSPLQPSLKKRRPRRDEERLAKVALKARSDDLGDSFPNDWIEFAIICVAAVGVIGGAVAMFMLFGNAT